MFYDRSSKIYIISESESYEYYFDDSDGILYTHTKALGYNRFTIVSDEEYSKLEKEIKKHG